MKPIITIADYGVGNLASVANMIHKAGGRAEITNNPVILESADRILLPGVGSFDACRAELDARPGIEDIVRAHAKRGKPLLGICVGMQLLADGSEEGSLPGLGLIPGFVRKFDFAGQSDAPALRIPHMGWSIVTPKGPASLFGNFANEPARFYFVHSYHFVCAVTADVAATAEYGGPFTAAVQHKNVFGVQFHPEKSHRFGMRLLQRFLEIGEE